MGRFLGLYSLRILLVPACRLKKENTMPKTPKNGHGIELHSRNEEPPEDIERAPDLTAQRRRMKRKATVRVGRARSPTTDRTKEDHRIV
ncbi:hypothetical protein A4A58_19645 [Tardiphaga robiniae]|uniref:Uncharacterized protein n=1 Tax=Tardiphaga robiniae TaxID=943830 RepID=A0A163X5H2_9BRAD|nr:hypothetical protein A4A58_19645 [Tardiphaga robiniae]